ncbi:ssl1300 [Synechocystis sp. PCC 6803]|uniref:Ssl1300 protein n=2 Tax=Synechocystis TaxID=1142 RepID=P72576_SYNY3|nr:MULTISPECIES: antitoxin [unclassified Synechocystis]MBD2616869.1 antitoxin [Synechocystis sp. FACHB-898]MBD2638183.1 antitoxin [Synechocystis sp. FACHB-908]MBD2661259.1 antitoxin [Synechocystis sp. FACHB-929]BAL30114.1 PEMI-like protein homologue [Synechocystis sp. PCC 6803 substr. GT-I]BAL33283.1 PEMI-like protein homologue [Synechocystis sp. PCC 6803 substr. PCC-N]BAL36452.1 PEMI-like protein homologue [Synechocystis sp. PCC 6803 substr. PCC-P]
MKRSVTMSSTYVVKLDSRGKSQSLTLPEDLRLNATEVEIYCQDGRLIIEPLPQPSLLAKLVLLDDIEESFPENFTDNLPLDNINL